MTKSETITHLAAALAKAQAEMPVAVFDATNGFIHTKYASLGSVINASRPILAKHGLSLVQFPINDPPPAQSAVEADGEKARGGAPITGKESFATTDYIGVESLLAHESGEFVSERFVLGIAHEKGKSRVQVAGSTLTYLRRYSWASILGMYSDEDADGSSPAQAFTAKAAPTLPPPPTRKL